RVSRSLTTVGPYCNLGVPRLARGARVPILHGTMPSRGRRQAAPGRPGAIAAATLLALALSATSCAEHMGKKASEGAIEAFKQKPPAEQPSRVIAGRAVAGALDALDDPEQQRRMRAIIDKAVDDAVVRTLDALNDPRQRQRMHELVTDIVDDAMARAFQSAT